MKRSRKWPFHFRRISLSSDSPGADLVVSLSVAAALHIFAIVLVVFASNRHAKDPKNASGSITGGIGAVPSVGRTAPTATVDDAICTFKVLREHSAVVLDTLSTFRPQYCPQILGVSPGRAAAFRFKLSGEGVSSVLTVRSTGEAAQDAEYVSVLRDFFASRPGLRTVSVVIQGR